MNGAALIQMRDITRKYAAVIVAGSLLLAMAATTTLDVIAADDLFIDYVFYGEIAARYLADGTYYLPGQLAGPYDLVPMSDVLYPPTALLLFVPFAVLPAVLWWVVPLGVTGLALARWRPPLGGVALILLLLSWPRAHAAFLFGNTDMWVMAAVAAGLLWGWPAIFITVKPSLLPLAAIGIRHRAWWIGAGGLVCLAVVQLPLWLDYLKVMRDVRLAFDCGLGSLPLVMVPVVGWWTGRSRPRGTSDPQPLIAP